jgi:hypothetical protein
MRILSNILVVLFVTTSAMGQQINPVPDYIFRNQMSVGRNAPTDTAAYLSVGPRYGANKGLMPPMVVDTNAVTGTKRNGLLIFSVQLNNFAYWDSTTSRFRQITAQAVVDSLVFSTRAWRKKGDDSLGAVIATRTDTALLSTRAYRQKAVDSLVTLISTLGGGTVLSVSAGTGMNFSTITTSGSVSADTSVLSTRAWRKKGDDSLGAVIAGKVNISDTATMLGAYLRKADTTAMLSPYLRKGDTAIMLSPYVRIAGYGLLKGTQTLSVDSATIATRARVQKGIDSVASLVAAPDSLLFSTRAWRQKGDDSLGAIIGTKATATGTTNYLSKFTGTSSLGNSIVYATTSEVGISTPSPTEALDVNGKVRIRTIDSSASPFNMLWTDATGVIRKTAVPSVGVDTLAISTRAWRQKGIDSVNANVALKVNISDTATMLSPYVRIAGFGLTKGTQTLSVDSVLIATRARVQKGIDSVANLSRVTGSGTTNYVAKFTGSTAVGNSQIFDNGSSVAINATNSQNAKFYVNDTTKFSYSDLNVAGVIIGERGNGSSLLINTPSLSTGFGSGLAIDGTYNSGKSVINLNAFGVFSGGPYSADMAFKTSTNTTLSEKMRLTNTGELLINTTTITAGGYNLQVAGGIYNTTGAVFAATSGNVGIGTASPEVKLDIASSGTTQLRIRRTGDADVRMIADAGGGILGTYTNDPMTFRTNQTEKMRITNDGDVLIGTSTQTAGYKLQVAGSIYNTTGAVLAATSGRVGIGTTTAQRRLELTIAPGTGDDDGIRVTDTSRIFQFGRTGFTYSYRGVAPESGLIYSNDNIALLSDGGYQSWHTNLGEVMRLTAAGNVGIGTTSPTERLHVNGRARIATIDSSASPINMLWADVDGVVRKTAPAVQGSGTTNRVSKFTASGTIGNGGIVDETTSEVMRITTANNVGIATTTPAEKLDVNGRIRVQQVDSSGTAPHALYVNSVGTITRGAFPAAGITGSGTVNRSAKFTSSGAIGNGGIVDEVSSEVMRITTANNVGIATTTPAEKLDVNGRIRVQQVDSSGTAPHVLYVNSVGTITKGAFQSGGGTVTSVATGFGIDGGTITSTGTLTADTVEMATRARVQKGIDSVAGLARVTGSGTANYFPYWTGTTALGNSEMYQLNSEVLIGYTTDQGTHKLQVNGNTFTNGSIKTAAPSGGTAAEWKLGTRVASSVTLDGTQYIEVDIGGTLYYLATVSFLEPKPKPNP